MINRIVKMTFDPALINDFLEVFHGSKDKIRQFDGCLGMILLQDNQQNNVLFTYSQWISEDHLNSYRHSELFKTTWANTKNKFISKAEAWSTTGIDVPIQ